MLESLIDLIVRHGGLALLNTHIRVEGNLDIKKSALRVMVKILKIKSRSLHEMICDEIKKLQVVSFCTSLLARFPDEEADEEVTIAILELISLAAEGSKTITKFIAEGPALNKIAVQLTIVLEEINQG